MSVADSSIINTIRHKGAPCSENYGQSRVVATPNGVAVLSPGLLYSATLGEAEAESATPTGLRPAFAATQSRHISLFIILGLRAATPLGLGPIAIRPPRVAEYGNPGLRAATPFWVPTTQVRVIQSPVVKLVNGPPDQGPCNARVAKPAFNN